MLNKKNNSDCCKNVTQRVVGLDIVRVILAIIIFLFHSRVHMQCDYGMLNIFVDKSNIVAMTAFFMLSGYSLIISNGRKNYSEFNNVILFYKKRFISIYPLYFVAGYLGVAMYIAGGLQTVLDNIILLPVEILCVQSFFDTLFPFAHNGGSWFISCLVPCYFLFPFLNILLKKIVSLRSLVCSLLLIMAFLAYVPYIVERFQTSSLYTNPFFRMVEFVSGMIIAIINSRNEQSSVVLRIIRNPIICIGSVIILIGGISLCIFCDIYYQWMPIIFFSVILFGTGYIPFTKMNNRYLLYLSSISYAFFLGQKFIWFPTKFVLHRTEYQIGNVTLILLTFIGCTISAIILHELVEKKASKFLKSKLL